MDATNDNAPKAGKCSFCCRSVVLAVRPFCSKRCAAIDLNRWLTGVYAVRVTDEDDEDGERPRAPGEEN